MIWTDHVLRIDGRIIKQLLEIIIGKRPAERPPSADETNGRCKKRFRIYLKEDAEIEESYNRDRWNVISSVAIRLVKFLDRRWNIIIIQNYIDTASGNKNHNFSYYQTIYIVNVVW